MNTIQTVKPRFRNKISTALVLHMVSFVPLTAVAVDFGECGDLATPIHAVQGSGFSSPMQGVTDVVIEGVVTGDFQEADQLNGFFLQEEDGENDGDASTSEGIFVYGGSDVNAGDLVRVQGEVTEYSGLTQLTNITSLTVCSSGNTVMAQSFHLPASDDIEFEQVEGMLVELPQSLTVVENYNLGRYGEVKLADERLFQFTHNNQPDPVGFAAHLEASKLRQITLDDGSSVQNPDPLIHPAPGLSADNTLRSGYTTSLTGNMSEGFGEYKIQPTETVSFDADNPRQEEPHPVAGNLKIASFNVLNYFTTFDTGAEICGPEMNLGCRGADDEDEFNRQRDKIIQAISKIDADIVGLIELENNSTDSLEDLISGVNQVVGAGTYTYIDTDSIGTDAIKQGFIYKPATVAPVGDFAILDSSVDPLFIDTKNRPSLAQTFALNSNGESFTLIVNHFKSKGSDCDDLGDPDKNDGQANCSGVRNDAATALGNWLATDPTQSNDPDFLIIGDLNAYAMDDAITTLISAGFTNLVKLFAGDTAYSYIFGAEAGYLDHALASSDLLPKVSGVTEWHINADEPTSLDYNLEYKSEAQQNLFYSPNQFRASDHDPVIVGLDLNAPPSCANAKPGKNTLWPPNGKFVPVAIMDVTDADGDDLTITIDSIFQDEPVKGKGPDGKGIDTSVAKVRAKREGKGNGRVYHIGFTATDNKGNACSNTVQVSVPKNKGKKGTAIDDGPLFDSTVK